MLHWRQAQNTLREIDSIDFSLADYKAMKVGQAIIPYKKHDDVEVNALASNLLKKYRAMFEAEKMERQAEEDDLF